MRTLWLAVIVAGLTVASGWSHALRIHRWGTSESLQQAGKHVTTLPESLGAWRVSSKEELGEEAARILECAGAVVRNYTNEGTGQVVRLALLAGPPGPISVHTPEICYSSRNYDIQGEPTAIHPRPTPDGSSDSFWSLLLSPKDPTMGDLHVCYGWSDGTQWVAADNPRLTYGDRQFLYKLQIASEKLAGYDADRPDACEDFLYELLNSGFDWNPID